MPLRIFLDSNHWITLAKVVDGKEKKSELMKIYKKIKKLSDSEHFIFPFSMFHLEDMMKRSNKKSRETIIDLIADISKGWVMKPYLLYFNKEIENATVNRLGLRSIHNIRSQIIENGFPYTAGEEYYFSSTTPEGKKFLNEKEQELRKHINSIESMTKMLKDDKYSSIFKKSKKFYDNFAIKQEKIRKQNSEIMTKTLRYNWELSRYFSSTVVPHLAKLLLDNNIEKEKVIPKTKKDIESFLGNMPAINVFFRLTYARDEESPERAIQSNDLIDISHLAGAIPYCDIVVVEKMFASLSKKQKLDKKYDCIICNSLQEFNNIISPKN